MTTSANGSTCSINEKLVELLEGGCDPSLVRRSADFADRLDALEVEALATYAPDVTLVMIRVAREAVEFAERIATRSGP